ncbi:hypothetical protein BC830DRAFT_257594 [Chytriomyces sp. MP71]|nr:hypothetical protein BC830DRAFT_257594 [Chytriomyces sp. MP71]
MAFKVSRLERPDLCTIVSARHRFQWQRTRDEGIWTESGSKASGMTSRLNHMKLGSLDLGLSDVCDLRLVRWRSFFVFLFRRAKSNAALKPSAVWCTCVWFTDARQLGHKKTKCQKNPSKTFTKTGRIFASTTFLRPGITALVELSLAAITAKVVFCLPVVELTVEALGASWSVNPISNSICHVRTAPDSP